jgi:hypothetical protein
MRLISWPYFLLIATPVIEERNKHRKERINEDRKTEIISTVA